MRSSKKPTFGSNNNRYVWKPAANPSWEKRFCNEIGNMSWPDLLEAERYIHTYPDVMNWKDSAVEEAFHGAKKRFWANINGLPCDIPLPDPDIYNHHVIESNNDDDGDQEEGDPYDGYSIEWDDLDDISNVENDFVQPLPPTEWGESSNEPILATGWGEGFDEPVPVTRWGDSFNEPKPVPTSGWGESYKHIVPTGWDDDNNNVTGDNKHITVTEWDIDNYYVTKHVNTKSRYKTSRLNGNNRKNKNFGFNRRPFNR
ncbi:uncharacterized protein LOC124909869 [Impatiens glandulifera]|uniref:uncharacterized protein LOC124909869 n=1 Tax=Impatiens glandulifera TaxID=253017 RepID=UPI001FB0C923|nr:uncharacterized protein LOC124909869 [Impatiens glandulifera]